MADPRLNKLADILVNYSTEVKKGDWVVIQGNLVTEPLAIAVAESVINAGGHPTLLLNSGAIQEAIYRLASKEQLEWISPISQVAIEKADVRISLMGTDNTRALSGVDPEKQRIFSFAHRELTQLFMNRAFGGDMQWVGTLFPCTAVAQEADMSLYDYENFVYSATFTDRDDPVAEWQKVHGEQQRVIDWLSDKKSITVKGPNADLSLSVEGRTFINADGRKNMPDGEIFTGPVEDSVNGWVSFSFPAIYSGREVEDVRLVFKDGKVVEATANKNESFLNTMLDTDEGARYVGEWAIGTNYGIQRFTKNMLFDEKMGGTMHIAVGASIPISGGKNVSAIHWDMLCDLKTDSEIRADGELFYKDGQFQV